MKENIISNIITIINNFNINNNNVNVKQIKFKYTKITKNFIKILVKKGFIKNVIKSKENNTFFYFLIFQLQQYNNLKQIRQISRPGCRIYSKYQKIPKLLGGLGIIILSTTIGIITDREARLKKIGGEIICYIW
uniref:ribosomal protein S8 n=1 Tax=Sarcophyte sanguinea TaxID=1618143 RepID=UPI0026E29ABE|nr:ribosomal protein S8 [Sarcophyte sanguinea]WJE89101.1 ribosomal protein S8 [Sarcophyte sanguinea]WJE89120.1 ribosomal protein S8 [Sarcophyte sanguinea]